MVPSKWLLLAANLTRLGSWWNLTRRPLDWIKSPTKPTYCSFSFHSCLVAEETLSPSLTFNPIKRSPPLPTTSPWTPRQVLVLLGIAANWGSVIIILGFGLFAFELRPIPPPVGPPNPLRGFPSVRHARARGHTRHDEQPGAGGSKLQAWPWWPTWGTKTARQWRSAKVAAAGKAQDPFVHVQTLRPHPLVGTIFPTWLLCCYCVLMLFFYIDNLLSMSRVHTGCRNNRCPCQR
jgi:hypothetical protein